MSDKHLASLYSSVVKLALGLETELEAYEKDNDRRSLVNALKEQLLLNRYAAACEAAAVLNAAFQVVAARLDGMPVNMLLRTITLLREISDESEISNLSPPDAVPSSTPHQIAKRQH
jgi:hypothetical protein